ncbi:hypothetical protein C0Z20_27225 [Trinickia symbiotica]|uniref:Uncharacterized protein n=1 Tax=Trinickia symbiotica TaxID=863227 RepID=A0A2N7WS64_9BURK|nr:hypothetical protein C0Z20_27225 [Trinickia symbiotica]
MRCITTHEELTEAIGQSFTFGRADGQTVEAVLSLAPAVILMNDSFVCYAATFELPPSRSVIHRSVSTSASHCKASSHRTAKSVCVPLEPYAFKDMKR